jgi:DNA-binding transcriptional LysR family regulator
LRLSVSRQQGSYHVHAIGLAVPTIRGAVVNGGADLELVGYLVPFGDDLYVEILFADKAVVVAGANNRWARRRKITLADVRDASWVGTPRETLTRTLLERAYQTANMPPPAMRVMTFSVQLRAHLLTTGDFLTTMPKSMLKLNPECRGLQELPITLPSPSFPVVLVTLKGRTLTPPAELFLHGLREHVRELGL